MKFDTVKAPGMMWQAQIGEVLRAKATHKGNVVHGEDTG